MRAGVVVVVVAGCTFSPTGARDDAAVGDDGDPDAPTDPDARDGAPPIDMSTSSFTCSTSANLRACYTFDGDILDRSGNNNDAMSPAQPAFTGGVDGSAVVTTNANLAVGDDPSLDVTNLTIRVQLRPTTLPTGGARAGLVESDAYRLFVLDGGTVRCALGDGTVEAITTATLPTGTFTRVACTYNGAQLRVFFDGTQRANTNAVTTIPSVTTQTTIGQSEPPGNGERFDGAIDDLEIWSSVESP